MIVMIITVAITIIGVRGGDTVITGGDEGRIGDLGLGSAEVHVLP